MAQSITPRQSLGQNFLRDPNTARKIVHALEARPQDPVVEIGPGTGALSGILAAKYENLTFLEIDSRAVELLRAQFPGLEIRRQDVLDVEWQALADEKGTPLFLIGNLPYNITSQILFSILDAGRVIRQAVFMMQLEVAERLVARSRTKAYGILSVWTQLHAVPKLLFRVSRNVFYPKPDVTSAVVSLELSGARGSQSEREFLRQVVRTAFNQRRKMLRNSLAGVLSERDVALPDKWANLRAEELSPGDFRELAAYLATAKKGDSL